jgi:hypothetical protein
MFESPRNQGKIFRFLGPIVVAGLFFSATLANGMAVTFFVQEQAVRDLPRVEAYEAIARDILAAQYFFGGLLVSLAAASIVAVVAGLIAMAIIDRFLAVAHCPDR